MFDIRVAESKYRTLDLGGFEPPEYSVHLFDRTAVEGLYLSIAGFSYPDGSGLNHSVGL